MLPDLSNKIKTLAGTSAVPDPGGKAFEYEFEIIKQVNKNILTITLNRPEKKNALNNVMVNEICYALAYAKQERSVRVIIIAAEGDIFCAGADLRREESESNVPKIEGADDISLMLRHLYKPVICKIQGSVLAGALLMVTNSTHATIEAGGVFIKDAAGLSAVISHDGSLRQLENITVDGGSF